MLSEPDARLHAVLALFKRGESATAEGILANIIKTEPARADVLFLLGTAQLQTGRVQEASENLQRAVDLFPSSAVYESNFGEAYRRLNQLAQAMEHLGRAVSIDPNLAVARYNQGLALRATGRVHDGLLELQRAVEIAPDIDSTAQLAEALCANGQYEQAALNARSVLAKRPLPVVHGILAGALHGLRDFTGAIAHYSLALEMEPNRASAHLGIGRALCDAARLDEGMHCLQRAAALDPNDPAPHSALADALVWSGDITEAIASARQASEKSRNPAVHSTLIYLLTLDPSASDAAILTEAQLWRERLEAPLMTTWRDWTNDLSHTRRIRIGYVSSGFRDKVDSYFTIPLLANHDHERFEIYCYSYAHQPDHFTEMNRAHANVWRDVARMQNNEVAELIRKDSIDILVDLAMHSPETHLALFARKPAPVQICWLAYPGTTGLEAMDYRITDPFLDSPACSVSQYSERSLWLPSSFWCYDPLRATPAVGELPALKNGHVTFASFNRFGKVNSQVLELWARVPQAGRDSRLAIFVSPGVHTAQVYRPFDELGVTRDRIVFTPAELKHEFLLRHNSVDLALDPFPCNGGATSLDALWMGVPVITAGSNPNPPFT